MNQKGIHIIFSLFFSAIFLFAGTGYNLVKYCCKDCRNAGIKMVTENTCETVHEEHHSCCTSHHQHTLSDSTEFTNEMSNKCDIDRLTVDIPSIQISQLNFTDYSLLFVELEAFQDCLYSSDSFSELKKYSHAPPDTAVPLRGRQILTLKSVLLI